MTINFKGHRNLLHICSHAPNKKMPGAGRANVCNVR